jgi:hypothetical protein
MALVLLRSRIKISFASLSLWLHILILSLGWIRYSQMTQHMRLGKVLKANFCIYESANWSPNDWSVSKATLTWMDSLGHFKAGN